MVLPVNNGNISLSCTIYSQLSVQHVRGLQALASCVYIYTYMYAPYLLSPIGRVCFVHLWLLCLLSTNHHKQKYVKKQLACLKLLDLHCQQIYSE